MLKVILAEAAAPRCRVVDRRRWAVGTRGWGGDGRRGLHGNQCHQPAQIVTGHSSRKGFKLLFLSTPG